MVAHPLPLTFNPVSYSARLHQLLYEKAGLMELEKLKCVGAILVALTDTNFRSLYPSVQDGQELAQQILFAIQNQLELSGLPSETIQRCLSTLFFLGNDLKLQRLDGEGSALFGIVRDIDDHLLPHLHSNSGADILGDFYAEFTRFIHGDKRGLGIVLTPTHIRELMVDLVGVDATSTVMDICCGTGGFLLSATAPSSGAVRLVGVEQNPDMYTCAVMTLVMRGLDPRQIYLGDCFSFAAVLPEATAGLLNPPYAQQVHELSFFDYLLDNLAPGSLAAAIVPLSCFFKPDPERELLLSKHRLEAVMSLPVNVFYPTNAIQCGIILCRAKVPHSTVSDPTWLALWKEDGFVIQGRNRVCSDGSWQTKKQRWLEDFRQRYETPGYAICRHLGATDEWCAEAHLEGSYLVWDDTHFDQVVRDYTQHLVGLWNHRKINRALEVKANSGGSFLHPSEWKLKTFRLSDLFSVVRGTLTNLPKENRGDTPIISARARENGIHHRGTSEKTFPPGLITLVHNSSNAGVAYYQPEEFGATTNVKVLIPGWRMTSLQGLYLCAMIGKSAWRYSYGRTISASRQEAIEILLPVDEEGTPDWGRVEAYLRSFAAYPLLGALEEAVFDGG